MPRGDLVVGVDCSTTAAKAVVWNSSGQAISQARSNFDLDHPRPNYAEQNPEDWWTDVEISLKGTFLCAHAVLPGMLARRRGRIVTLSSYAAIEPRRYQTAYASAKAAVLRLTDSLAAELDGAHHRLVAEWEDDVLRANDVVVAGRPDGTVLLRFTPGNLRHDAARVAAQLRAVLL